MAKKNPWKKLLNHVQFNTFWLIRDGDPDNPKHWRDPKSPSHKQKVQLMRGEDISDIKGKIIPRSGKTPPKKCYLQWEDLEKLWIRQDHRCAWFGIKPNPLELFESKSPWALSVDRIDDNGDYTVNNIMITTRFANFGRWKSDMESTREFIHDLIDKFMEDEYQGCRLTREFIPGIMANENYTPPVRKTLF